MKAAGILELNALFLAVGLLVLWALTGWTTWRAALADVGLAYMLGLGSVGVAATLVLIAGFGLSYGSILLVSLLIGAAAAGVAVRRRSPLPRGRGSIGRPQTVGDYLGIVAAVLTVLVSVALFRAFRNQPLVAWDAWSFWIPKAKVIYFFGGIHSQLFTSLPAPSYPLFVPALDAMVFRFTHSADESLLAVQNWFLFVGFVGAAAAILGRIARRSFVWTFLAVAAVIPEVEHRWFQLMADWTLDAFFVLGALLVLRWLRTGERWTLAAAFVTLAAMLATKREGQLLAACLVVGACAATYRSWRRSWPLVLGVAVAAYAVNVPWRIWWSSRHLTPDTPDNGLGHFTGSLSRVLPSLRIVLEVTFDYKLWLLAVPIAGLAALAALGVRELRAQAYYFFGTGVAVILAFAWVIWSDPTLPLSTVPSLTPIPRAMGSLAFLSLGLAPVLATGLAGGDSVPVFDRRPRELVGSLRGLGDRIEALSPVRVVAAFVALEWLAVIAAAGKIRHAGWIYYQGGDQLWYYTLGWLLGHGQLTQTQVGYGWSTLLAPIARVAGPDLVSAFPVIVLFDVLILLPIAMLALYGIAARIGGRLFGYWALLLWVVVPFVGVLYTNQGYHQKYTELLLPQAFGLTAMADMPTTVATLVAVYFAVRVLFDERPQLVHAVAAGVAAGVAIAIKPSAVIFLAGPALALAYRRLVVPAAAIVAGLAPAVVALAVWKQLGLGSLPILSGHGAVPRGVAAAPPVAGLNLGHYLHTLSWSRFLSNLDLLREHFWSGRLIEWIVIAGVIALARRSITAALLVGGWFFAFAIVKGAYGQASIEDGSFFRVMMPSYPAFLLLIAALPLLLPHAATKLRPWRAAVEARSARVRWGAVGAAIVLSAIVPLGAFAAASRSGSLDPTTLNATIMPVPANVDIGLTAAKRSGKVVLTWNPQRPLGGPVFYRIWRAPADTLSCPASAGARICNLTMPEVGTTHAAAFTDAPKPGHWVYRVAVAANWLNDVTYGDPYLVSRPLSVTIP